MRRRFPSWRRNLERPGVQKVVRNTGWLFADRAIRLGVGFLVSVWVARHLGPQAFGLLSYAGTIVALFGTVVTLGADSIVVRDLVRNPREESTILATATAVRTASAVATTAAVVAFAFAVDFRHPQTRALVLLSALALLFRPIDIVDLWFQAQTNARPAILARSASFLLASAARVLLILSGASILAFAACEPLAAAIAAIFLLHAFRRHGRRFSLAGASTAEARLLLGGSWPLLLSGMAIMVYARIDQVMLVNLLGDRGAHAVGLYAVAIRFSEVWSFVPVAIVASVFPKIVASKEAGARIYAERFARLFSLMTVTALLVSVPATFFAGDIIELVFGSTYHGAGPILAIHIWTTLFVSWGVLGEAWFLNEGLTRLSLYRTAGAALLNIGANFILIPRYGGIGAATATLVSMACAAWLFNLASARTRPIFLLQLRSLALRGLLR